MRLLFVILDGAADRADAVLGGLTPLQAAKMPNLRQMASEAVKGMMNPIGQGIAPESDAAVFSILGYEMSSYTGRGPLEAFGAGLKVTDRSVAFRCNFATINQSREIIDRRAGRIDTRDAKTLQKEISEIDLGIEGVRFRFKSTVGHRGVCVFYSRRNNLSSKVSNADIGYVRRGGISVAEEASSRILPKVVALDDSEAAASTAMIVNTFIDKVIERLSVSPTNAAREGAGMLKANAVLLRDAGMGLPSVKTFEEKTGLNSAFLAEMPVEMGIAKVLGMDPIRIKRIKNRKRRYRAMADLVRENSDRYDFIYVHIKGPDEPGHDGDAKLKKRILEEIDEGFFAGVRDLKTDLCVTCDHSTPCQMKAHSSDPVPVMLKRQNSNRHDDMAFDELIDGLGSLGVINGNEIVDRILKG